MKKDDHSKDCVTRLLTIITVFIAIQTISLGVIIYGVYTAYDRHKHDLNALGSVPWGDMANDLKSQYLHMDKNAINNIIKNSHNMTHKANLLVHTHGESIAEEINAVTKKASDNTDIIDLIRKMVYEVDKPIKEISDLISHQNMINIKEIVSTIANLTSKLDEIQLNKLVNIVIEILQKIMKDFTPETIQHISEVIKKMDSLMSEENNQLFHSLAEDTDHTVQSVNKLFKIFESVSTK